MLTDLVSSAIDLIFNIILAILKILPASFVTQQLESMSELPLLSYVNWLIPFNDMKPILTIWLSSCLAIVTVSIIQKNIKSK